MAYTKKLEGVLAQINKNYGAGSVVNLTEIDQTVQILCSSGSMTLDLALGINGIAKGRFYEIYGPESSGKTTLAIHTAVECQKVGGVVAYIDMEHAFDYSYGKNLGLDIDNLIFSQPNNGEQALDIMNALIDSKEVDLIILDSIAAMTPRSELDGEAGDLKLGLHARLMSQACRKLSGKCSKNEVTIIWINQLRDKIGVIYGPTEVVTGGNALKYYASVRLDIRRKGKISSKGDAKEIIANLTRVRVIKNKLAPPFKEAEFQIVFGKGISKESEFITTALNLGILDHKGTGVHLGFDTPLWDREFPINTTEDKTIETLASDEFADIYLLIRVKVQQELKQDVPKVDRDKLNSLEVNAVTINKDFDEAFKTGSEASSKSNLDLAWDCFKKATDLKPYHKIAQNKLKDVEKRLAKKGVLKK